jgi:hypothetical protein
MHTFADRRAFQFSDGGEDRENHFAHRCARVNALLQADEVDAERSKLFESAEKVRSRASESVEAPNRYRVEPTPPSIGH